MAAKINKRENYHTITNHQNFAKAAFQSYRQIIGKLKIT